MERVGAHDPPEYILQGIHITVGCGDRFGNVTVDFARDSSIHQLLFPRGFGGHDFQ